MQIRLLLSILVLSLVVACSGARGEAADNPGAPTPLPDPAPGTDAGTPAEQPTEAEGPGGLPAGRGLPVRPEQAPLVHVRDALDADSLLHRRVRVAGRCTAAGAGRRAGSWTLEEGGSSIEVRGLVPPSCGAQSTQNLTIFAQIEPKTSDSRDRLLLRLPD
jgi:hypothetical protein